jgi:hypothetical protein
VIGLVGLFLLALTTSWLLWHYAPERKLAIVRFAARASAGLLGVYEVILLFAMFEQREWLNVRLGEGVPIWAAVPIVWGVWGGWSWLHVGEWISGPRGR